MILKIGKYEFGSIKNQAPAQNHRNFLGKYDAAQTNHLNSRHWANADNLSADQANNPGVRKTLRERSRYEISNNTYMGGMVETFANEVIGTGARMEFEDVDPTVNFQIEAAWRMWFEEIGGAEKTKMMFQTSVGDGESFAVEVNGNNPMSRVSLDYMLLDCERCTNGFAGAGVIDGNDIDGIKLNQLGKPVSYSFLLTHPGDNAAYFPTAGKSRTIGAENVIHFFKPNRPEQHRGVPEITSALPLGAKMRSFTLSTIEAARIASTFSGVLHTTGSAYGDALSPGGSNGAGGFSPMEELALENGQFLALPEGWEMKQVKAEHPTTTYPAFKKSIVAEMSRSLLMPYNVAAGDSAGMNFASGRLDRLTWRKVLQIRQKDVERRIMFKMFMAWWNEAILIDGLLPPKVRRFGYMPKFKWFFDGDVAIDPQKESKADETDLLSGATTFADVYARKGKNWKEQIKQRAVEKEEMERLGLTVEEVVEPAPAPAGDIDAKIEEIVHDAIEERKIK